MKSFALLSFCGFLALSACGGNPFAPERISPEPGEIGPDPEPAPPATTPEQLMDNLARAMRTRDENLYENLLDEDFLFTELDCLGEVVFHNNLEEELDIMAGSRDGSQEGIFDRYRHSFTFNFTLKRRYQELGSDYPENFPGDPNSHPDEDWEVFFGLVQMEMLESAGEGYRVEQDMTYKLRRDLDDGLWKIVRWENKCLGST